MIIFFLKTGLKRTKNSLLMFTGGWGQKRKASQIFTGWPHTGARLVIAWAGQRQAQKSLESKFWSLLAPSSRPLVQDVGKME